MRIEQLQDSTTIPEGVTATLERFTLTAKGEKGEVFRRFPSKRVTVEVKGNKVVVTAQNATLKEKKLLYTFLAHIRNMLRGVNEGHTYKLKICSGHFPMNVAVKDGALQVKNFIGEAVPRNMQVPTGVDVKVDGDHITVSGADKEVVARTAGRIENLTRRPGFDSRIFQDGIYLIEKDGKVLS